MAFEIDGGEGERGRNGNRGLGEALALPGLRGGVIDFENAEMIGEWIAVGAGIEAGSENDELSYTR